METTTFEVRTGSQFACIDVTDRVAGWLRGKGDGLCHVFAPHATAGLGVMETGAGSEADARSAVERLLPREDTWSHRHGSPGHGADHVLPVFVAPFVVLPVLGGQLALGAWQSVVLIDPNVDNATRTVRVSFVAG